MIDLTTYVYLCSAAFFLILNLRHTLFTGFTDFLFSFLIITFMALTPFFNTVYMLMWAYLKIFPKSSVMVR